MKTLLVDGNNLAYRMFAVLPPLTTSSQKQINVIFGFVKALRATLDFIKPTSVNVIWDDKPEARRSIYSEYKAHRNQNRTEEEIAAYKNYLDQIQELYESLDYLGIHQYKTPGVEADDIISMLSTYDTRCVIMSEDRDFIQLVSPRVDLYRPIKNKRYTAANIESEVGLNQKQYLMMRILSGDKSDNIPGVPGIGEKTATTLSKKYSTLNDLLADEEFLLSNKRTAAILCNKELISRNDLLMNLNYSRNYVPDVLECKKARFNSGKVKSAFASWEFMSLLLKWQEFKKPFEGLV